ncbi:DMT transporter permease [Hyphomicrobium nitrativorans NL23]|uniref:DMT transporter permease n=1 Tax=Hyphomicrobium nitrativorans NL23 TaxID=1029756 RepID=V5SFW1_9HYPH|nr:DMT family transporter [Hyphomicrobium nitrativorans]AHB49423.1 DMT transporter permease [Hyphomicrobium nitrativorans NL23]
MQDKQHPAGAPRASGFAALGDNPWVLMLLPGLFWAGNAIVARSVTADVPPIGLAFWRWTLAALVVLPIAWPHLARDLPKMRERWPIMLLLTTLGISIFNTFLYIAAHTTTAINIVMLQTAMPIVVVLATFLIFREAVTGRQAAGIVASFAGTLILISHGDPDVLLNLDFKRGDLWMLAAVVCYAVYTALLRVRPPVHGFSFAFASFALGALLLLPFYVAETILVGSFPVTTNALAALGYVAVFASVFAYMAFNRTVALLGANLAGLTVHLIPVFGIVLAVLLLGERVHLYHGAGIALIAFGLWLATRKPTTD